MFTKISEILFAYIQEKVYVCREDSVNTNHHSIFMDTHIAVSDHYILVLSS